MHATRNVEAAPQLAGELATWLTNGAPMATTAELAMRERVCAGDATTPRCDQWQPVPGTADDMHCASCKCLSVKLKLATARCPLDKWVTLV